MRDQHYGQFEEGELHDLANACYESIPTNVTLETCPFCPQSDQRDGLMADGGIQHLTNHLMSFSRISFDGYTEEQSPYSDASSSTHRTKTSADQILSGTITDGLKPDFFDFKDESTIDLDLMEAQHSMTSDPGEDNWDLFSETQERFRYEVRDDPVLRSFRLNQSGNEQFEESTSILTAGLLGITSFDIEHQITLDGFYFSEAGYAAYLHHVVEGCPAEILFKDNTKAFTLQIRLSNLIKRHEILVDQIYHRFYEGNHHRIFEHPESLIDLIGILGDWLDQAKFNFMEYFEAASEVLRQDYASDLPGVEAVGSPRLGMDIETHLDSPRWRLGRYRHFLSTVDDGNISNHTKRRSAASVIQQVNKLLHYGDFLLDSGSSEAVFYLPYDRSHVANKYPNAEKAIVDRLALAITQRRSVIRYRQRQRDELDKDFDQATNGDEKASFINKKLESSLKKSTKSPSGGISRTTADGNGETFSSLPSFPMNGTPFECQFCFSTISISNQRSWSRHIFSDLIPYISFYPNCRTPNRLFERRREWFIHLQIVHSVSGDPAKDTVCPLCTMPISSGEKFMVHLAHHLKQLMLFALPRLEEPEESSDAMSESTLERNEDVGWMKEQNTGTSRELKYSYIDDTRGMGDWVSDSAAELTNRSV